MEWCCTRLNFQDGLLKVPIPWLSNRLVLLLRDLAVVIKAPHQLTLKWRIIWMGPLRRKSVLELMETEVRFEAGWWPDQHGWLTSAAGPAVAENSPGWPWSKSVCNLYEPEVGTFPDFRSQPCPINTWLWFYRTPSKEPRQTCPDNSLHKTTRLKNASCLSQRIFGNLLHGSRKWL